MSNNFKDYSDGFIVCESEQVCAIKERLIRLPEVMNRTGLARSTIYLYIRLGKFPRNRNLIGRSVAWAESEVDGWIRNRLE